MIFSPHDSPFILVFTADARFFGGSHPSCKLFSKLSSFGIAGNLLKWLREFLFNCWQCTRVGRTLSTPVSITSGVIQWSYIGPLLFLLVINSLTKVFSSDVTCILFADDVKLYSVI